MLGTWFVQGGSGLHLLPAFDPEVTEYSLKISDGGVYLMAWPENRAAVLTVRKDSGPDREIAGDSIEDLIYYITGHRPARSPLQ
jgi:hypothetical protein